MTVSSNWKLRNAGVESRLLVTEGGSHSYSWEPSLPEAISTRRAVYAFVQTHAKHTEPTAFVSSEGAEQ